MNAAEYQRVLHSAHGLRALARQIARDGALDEAIAAISHADSVGPILDPTLYRERQAAMEQDEVTLRAVRVLAQLGDRPENLRGAGSAPGPAPDASRQASDPPRGTPAPAPVKPLRAIRGGAK